MTIKEIEHNDENIEKLAKHAVDCMDLESLIDFARESYIESMQDEEVFRSQVKFFEWDTDKVVA